MAVVDGGGTPTPKKRPIPEMGAVKKPKRAARRAVTRALQSPNSPAGVAKASRGAAPAAARKVLGRANAVTRGKGKKVGLKKLLAKTTGTTTGEAAGILKNTRKAVRKGNLRQAQRKLAKSLSGGPRAGVRKTPGRAVAASKRSQKVVGKIAAKQAGRARRKYGR